LTRINQINKQKEKEREKKRKRKKRRRRRKKKKKKNEKNEKNEKKNKNKNKNRNKNKNKKKRRLLSKSRVVKLCTKVSNCLARQRKRDDAVCAKRPSEVVVDTAKSILVSAEFANRSSYTADT